MSALAGSSSRSPNWSFSSDYRTHNTRAAAAGIDFTRLKLPCGECQRGMSSMERMEERIVWSKYSQLFQISVFTMTTGIPWQSLNGAFLFQGYIVLAGGGWCSARVWDQNLIKIWKGCLTFCCCCCHHCTQPSVIVRQFWHQCTSFSQEGSIHVGPSPCSNSLLKLALSLWRIY